MITTTLRVEAYWHHGKRKLMFRLAEPHDIVLPDQRNIIIPAGYETDFASVPRALRWLIPAYHTHFIPALVHDFFYDHRLISRKYADDLFLKMMQQYGTPKLMRYIMYYGVRLGGHSWWVK